MCLYRSVAIFACAFFGVFPAVAQGFPDTPENHWAYDAVARLHQDGILVGYPDGLFRGNRPASRYEMAVAINAAYQHLKSIADGLKAQLDDLMPKEGVNVDANKEAIAQLRDELESMKGWGRDIDDLKSLAAQFEKELTSLGLDVEQMKVDLGGLVKRIGVLEAHKLPIDIHGNADLFMISGASMDHRPGITEIGRPVGVRIPFANGAFDMAGLDVDSTIYHELDLIITSNDDRGPKWHSDVAISNLYGPSIIGMNGFRNTGAAFASMSGTGAALVPFSAGVESVYLSDLAFDFDCSMMNHGISAELGRTGYSIDPYIYQRPNPDPYFKNEIWNDGKWYFDGGVVDVRLGGVTLNVFGGKQDQPATTAGGSPDVMPMTIGFVGHPYTPGVGSRRPAGLISNNPGGGLENGGAGLAGIPVNEALGLNLKVPIGSNGKLDLAYLWFESNNGVAATGGVPSPAGGASNAIANRADVYGGDLHWNLSNFGLEGGYAASDLKMGNTNLTAKNNFAWHAQLSYDTNRWGIVGGYRDIEPQFGAPGDWGRIGIWWNPTDIRGPMANAHFDLNKNLRLSAAGEWVNGTGESFASPALGLSAPVSGLSTHDRIDHYTAELGWRLSDSLHLSLGTELVYWHLPEASLGETNPTETWYNLGLGLSLTQQAWLSFFYQMSNYDSKGNPDFQVFNPAYAGSKYNGSLLTTQLSVKF